MATEGRVQGTSSVDRAINTVLLAEQEARDSVEQCHAEAARILAEAEERARRISQNAERRVRRAHRIADRSVERARQGLRAPASGSGSLATTREAGELVGQVVDALVDEILGGP